MIIPKLGVTCFVVTAIEPFVTMVYHSSSHSFINYGIIFQWNSSNYKIIITIIMGVRFRDSCRKFFKILNIIPLISQYIFSLLLFKVNNKNQFQINSEIHSINTRSNSDFYQLLSHLTIYSKGNFCRGIKVHNSLPPEINIYLIILRNLNHLWEGFFTHIHFIHWKNISIIKQL